MKTLTTNQRFDVIFSPIVAGKFIITLGTERSRELYGYLTNTKYPDQIKVPASEFQHLVKIFQDKNYSILI